MLIFVCIYCVCMPNAYMTHLYIFSRPQYIRIQYAVHICCRTFSWCVFCFELEITNMSKLFWIDLSHAHQQKDARMLLNTEKRHETNDNDDDADAKLKETTFSLIQINNIFRSVCFNILLLYFICCFECRYTCMYKVAPMFTKNCSCYCNMYKVNWVEP